MASCNNCSLKEKEQVYTAARDGNLMYMKVSVGVEPFRALCSRKQTRSIRDGLFVEPWTLLVDVLFILIRFSEVSVCVRNSAENFIDFDSICRTIVTFNAGAKIKISRWIRFWKNLSKISLSVIKNVFFFSSLLKFEHAWCAKWMLLLSAPKVITFYISLCGNFRFEGFSPSDDELQNLHESGRDWKLTCRDCDVRLTSFGDSFRRREKQIDEFMNFRRVQLGWSASLLIINTNGCES